MEELLKERRVLIEKRKKLLLEIEKVQPPEGCFWTDKKVNEKLMALSCQLSKVIDDLDNNKAMLRIARKSQTLPR